MGTLNSNLMGAGFSRSILFGNRFFGSWPSFIARYTIRSLNVPDSS